MTDLWVEEGTRGTNLEHGLHAVSADVPEKAAATPVPRDARRGSPLLIPSAWRARERHCAYLYLYVQICIAIRSEFPVRKRPSKGWRGRLLEALAKTRNGRKHTPEAIKRDTPWLERLRPRDPEAVLPNTSDCLRLAPSRKHRAYLYHYPR